MAVDIGFVVPLRLARIAGGGAAGVREARLMIDEKIAANTALAVTLVTGALGVTPEAVASGTLRHYGRHVRANRERLSAGKS